MYYVCNHRIHGGSSNDIMFENMHKILTLSCMTFAQQSSDEHTTDDDCEQVMQEEFYFGNCKVMGLPRWL